MILDRIQTLIQRSGRKFNGSVIQQILFPADWLGKHQLRTVRQYQSERQPKDIHSKYNLRSNSNRFLKTKFDSS